MKNNTDTNLQCDTTPATKSVSATTRQPAGSARLKWLIAVVAMTAVWLSYQSVSETIALHRQLDRMRAAMSEGLLTEEPSAPGSNITETKPPVAGL